jgi:hypothetical protein
LLKCEDGTTQDEQDGCHHVELDHGVLGHEVFLWFDRLVMEAFIATPLAVRKIVYVVRLDLAAILAFACFWHVGVPWFDGSRYIRCNGFIVKR